MNSADRPIHLVGHTPKARTMKVSPIVYTGVHMLTLARSLPTVMVSVNRLVKRRSDFLVNRWIMNSGAFSRISSGAEHLDVSEYASLIDRWATCGQLEAAVE